MSTKKPDSISVTLTRSLENSSFTSIHAAVKGFEFHCRIIVLISKKTDYYETYIEHDEKLDLVTLIDIRAASKKIKEDLKSGVIETGFSN